MYKMYSSKLKKKNGITQKYRLKFLKLLENSINLGILYTSMY